ncbi:unnamed protein product [Lathyrus sativus]|nr:unnamed protein product [Lathyrus sativus]
MNSQPNTQSTNIWSLNTLLSLKQRARDLVGHRYLKYLLVGSLYQLGIISLQRLANKYIIVTLLRLGQTPTMVVSSTRLANEALKTNVALEIQPRNIPDEDHEILEEFNVVILPKEEQRQPPIHICFI